MKEQNYLDHLVGVVGHPVAENPGVVIQDAAFADMGLTNWRYLTLDVDPDQLDKAIGGLRAFGMRGINCTMPHKIKVLEYLDEISESAKLIGAVNTIVNNEGRLFGENTDGKGFMESLRENGIDPQGKAVVVLGAGGASRAICVELLLAGVGKITVVNREAPLTEGLKKVLAAIPGDVSFDPWEGTYKIPADCEIFINATSVGLYPHGDQLPDIDPDSIRPDLFVQDVIPNPAMTALMHEAKKRGARYNTGTGMLINQAALNIEMWTGKKPNKQVMLAAFEEAMR